MGLLVFISAFLGSVSGQVPAVPACDRRALELEIQAAQDSGVLTIVRARRAAEIDFDRWKCAANTKKNFAQAAGKFCAGSKTL